MLVTSSAFQGLKLFQALFKLKVFFFKRKKKERNTKLLYF